MNLISHALKHIARKYNWQKILWRKVFFIAIFVLLQNQVGIFLQDGFKIKKNFPAFIRQKLFLLISIVFYTILKKQLPEHTRFLTKKNPLKSLKRLPAKGSRRSINFAGMKKLDFISIMIM